MILSPWETRSKSWMAVPAARSRARSSFSTSFIGADLPPPTRAGPAPGIEPASPVARRPLRRLEGHVRGVVLAQVDGELDRRPAVERDLDPDGGRLARHFHADRRPAEPLPGVEPRHPCAR